MADGLRESVVPSRRGIGPVLCGRGQMTGIPCLHVGQPRQAAGHGRHRYCSPGAMAVIASVDARSVVAKAAPPAAIAVAVERSRAAIVDVGRACGGVDRVDGRASGLGARNRDGRRRCGGRTCPRSRRCCPPRRAAPRCPRRSTPCVKLSAAGIGSARGRFSPASAQRIASRNHRRMSSIVGVASSACHGRATRCSSGRSSPSSV